MMPLIDERARVLGKVNLLDAVVALVVLAVSALGYGAFVLFRAPVPVIVSLEPQQVIEGGEVTVQILGRDLRPFLRARVGDTESRHFALQSPTLGEVTLPAGLPPGDHDLTLYDEGRLLTRKERAVTVIARPSTMVQVVGAFLGAPNHDVRKIAAGSAFPPGDRNPVAFVLEVAPPEPAIRRVRVGANEVVATSIAGDVQVPATIRVRCQIVNDGCRVGEQALTLDSIILLPVRVTTSSKRRSVSPGDQVSFLVTEVRAADAHQAPRPVTVVQAIGAFVDVPPEEAEIIRAGLTLPPGGHDVVAEVLAVQRPQPGRQRVNIGGTAVVATPATNRLQVPAIIRVRCQLANEQCRVGDAKLVQDAIVRLPRGPLRPGASWPLSESELDDMRFLVKDVRPADAKVAFPTAAVATVRVRFVVRPELVRLVQAGDLDVGGPLPAPDAERATLTAVDSDHYTLTAMSNVDAAVGRSFQLPETVVAFTGTVRVPVVEARSGWIYKDKSVKVGAPFVFETIGGFMEGIVVEMSISPIGEAASR